MTKSLNINGFIKMLDDTTTINSEAINVYENFTEVVSQETILDASDVDVSISFGGIASDATLLIFIPTYSTSTTADNYLTCKINGGSEVFNVGKILVLSGHSTTGIDSITFSNPDTTNSVSLKSYICK